MKKIFFLIAAGTVFGLASCATKTGSCCGGCKSKTESSCSKCKSGTCEAGCASKKD